MIMDTANSASDKGSAPAPAPAPAPASPGPSQPFYQAYPVYTTTPQTVVYLPQRGPQRRRSFCGWLLRAFLLFVAFSILFKSINLLVRGGGSSTGSPSTDPSKWSYDIPSHVNYHGCIKGDEWTPSNKGKWGDFPHSATTSFDVPLDHAVYLVERGQLSGGKATYTTSPSQPAGTAKIEIVGWFFRHDLFGLVKACSIERDRGEKENGVGIFTPRWHHWHGGWNHEDRVNFVITVTLPEGSSSKSPSWIKGLISDVPNTSQELVKLSSLVFNSITLVGTNAAIDVEALHAREGTLVTTNGHISGKFDTDSKLSLVTSNGRIDVDVDLLANKTDASVSFNAHTTNAKLRAGVALQSRKQEGGSFSVSTTTSNGASSVSIPNAPLGSKLSLASLTSNGRAEVALHPTFEGEFLVTNSASSKIQVDVDESVSDPSGEKRQRHVTYSRNTRGFTSGEVYWGTKSEKTMDGLVSLSTSNGPAALSL